MQVPLTVSFHGLPVDEAIRSACWHEAEKLERYYARITSCHVTVSRSTRHKTGNPFELHVRLAVPGGEIVVTHGDAAPETNAALAVRHVFDEVRRRLQDYARRQRGDEKHHEPPPLGEPPAEREA
jgi:ribosome-associated translation inhibitor RaiA